MGSKSWTSKDIAFLKEHWGDMEINKLAKCLGRSVEAIKLKIQRLKCGSWYENMKEHETFECFVKRCWGRNTTASWYVTKMEETGYKFETVRKYNNKNSRPVRIITEESFLRWLKNHKCVINIGETYDGCFGYDEPDWVKEKRKIDRRANEYMKMRDWTEAEDKHLLMLLKSYKYGYREISIILKRTEGAIKRRMLDKGYKERPLRKDPHEKWTADQIEKVEKLYKKGYPSVLIAEYLPKSALAINGILERYNYFGVEDRKKHK